MSLQDQDTLALSTELTEEDVNVGLRLAIDQAMKSLGEGGIPIGASYPLCS
ncbi:hypothetical protein [Phaffia rhodozyma]|uniref:Uncharacterized protein n=1 Tax=Phaffia rhodozyma TaxID=264483 RepID=A0A0F7SPF6_PHARH|nr:hypothetical protein [Phaffia rhodozyma]